MTVTLTQIFVYPVKGLSPQPLQTVTLTAGECMPNDRRFAISHGASQFDPTQPSWVHRSSFAVLARVERLAALGTSFDAETGMLVIRRNGRPVVRGNITTPTGRMVVDDFLNAYLRDDVPGRPKLIEAAGVNFTDINRKSVSLINAASVRDIERVIKRPVDLQRFRGNLVIDGLAPWAEFDLIGSTLHIGGAELRPVERIDRCPATNVEPGSGNRDMNIPRTLMRAFDHIDCGVHVDVVSSGTMTAGDTVTIEKTAP